MSEEFDGQEISGYVASLPAMKLEAPESYQRGTYITLQVEVRVKSAQYNEISAGKNKGDLLKNHVLSIEDVSILNVVTPQERLAILEAAAAAAQAEIDAQTVEEHPGVEDLNDGEAISPTPAEETEEQWEYEEIGGAEGVAVPEREEVSAGF